jgi:hypothetical protein
MTYLRSRGALGPSGLKIAVFAALVTKSTLAWPDSRRAQETRLGVTATSASDQRYCIRCIQQRILRSSAKRGWVMNASS